MVCVCYLDMSSHTSPLRFLLKIAAARWRRAAPRRFVAVGSCTAGKNAVRFFGDGPSERPTRGAACLPANSELIDQFAKRRSVPSWAG